MSYTFRNLNELRTAVKELWFVKSQRGYLPLSTDERNMMYNAYHTSTLPKDVDYNLYQWVEDNCPCLM